ncbi:MAG: TonB-dependent receptor plug domain-containing protein [Azonexus sp.]
MHPRYRPLAAAMALAFSSTAYAQSAPEQSRVLDNVQVSASRIKGAEPDSSKVGSKDIAAQQAASSDTTDLLRNVPGLAISSAGGVSGLPVLHGMADDRNRIKIDGMDLISACANHMNSPLSYIAPSNVDSIQVYAGISPVSLGGDSIGGSIIVKSKAPRFAESGAGLLTTGELGSFYRSNGNAWGVNASATVATENLSITYNGSTAESGNYKSARDFKPAILAAGTTAGTHSIAGNEVGSSAYKTENHALGIAYKLDNHLFDLKLGYQFIPYQGFPNQHMDMTENQSTQVNLGYTGKYAWGKLETRVYHEETRHKMDFAEDKLYWYRSPNTPCAPASPTCVTGMPMDTEGKNTGVLVKAEIPLAGLDLLRIGGEYQRYRLSDWWDPSGGMMMWPNAFQNINNGQRDRYDIFGEWEAAWGSQWTTLAGVRGSLVDMNTGTVQGYNTGAAYAPEALAFNNRDRSRTDRNLDLTLLARYTANAEQSYEGGYSRKTRSPSLYERYTWSTNGMSMTMNNWINDGNGYKGDLDLKPEVAHTISFTADWHDAAKAVWGVKVTPYYSHIDNYIDAKCLTSCTSGRYNYLTLVNQDARIYGIDLSGFATLGRMEGIGNFLARGLISYVNGENRSTGDNLYNIMPLNARLALEHRLGNWTNTIEEQVVSAKNDVSAVRNENKTSAYDLLNLRSSYEWKNIRFDIGLENALNKQYSLPLGGAYIGQGRTMSLGSATTWTSTGNPPWGYQVPGMGRSLYAGINIKF